MARSSPENDVTAYIVVEDFGHLGRNRRVATGRDMLWSPTIRAAPVAGTESAARPCPEQRKEGVMMRSTALTEASELEIKAVISRYEPRMQPRKQD
jgi:hypothetical protein